MAHYNIVILTYLSLDAHVATQLHGAQHTAATKLTSTAPRQQYPVVCQDKPLVASAESHPPAAPPEFSLCNKDICCAVLVCNCQSINQQKIKTPGRETYAHDEEHFF